MSHASPSVPIAARRWLLLILGLLAVVALRAVAPEPARAADPLWVCGPGAVGIDPCRGSLTTTVVDAQLKVRRTEKHPVARRPEVDCFYVYPTVTDGGQTLAEAARDPSVRSVARFQAARYAQHCRVYAPAYRQVGLAAIAGATGEQRAARDTAYRDVRTAWRAYRRAHPDRGVVVIAHSQGTAIARRLLREEVDPKPAQRRRLVSAVLLGGDVQVSRSRTGGDFRGIDRCRDQRQTGCVVAYSAFGGVPPADSVFGRVRPLDGLSGLRVLCTNPSRLAGGSGPATLQVPLGDDAGLGGAATQALLAALPDVDTPWVSVEGAYRARCSAAAGANVLRISTTGALPAPTAVPTAGWGLHLADANIVQGELVGLVGRQADAWARPARGRG